MTKLYAIYARQSLDREGAGLAVARQVEDCEALACRLNLPGKPVIYSDNDVSATSRRRRPGYAALLAALRAGTHDVLLIWHNDRLHRRPMELEQFIEIAEAVGLTVYAVQAGQLDLTTPSGRMVARIVGAVARQEVEHKSARRTRSNYQRALMGVRAGGTRGFGYGVTVLGDDGRLHDRDLTVVNKVEARAITDAAVRIISGELTTVIWRSWNTAGLRTPTGRTWEASTFARTMTRPALAGRMIYRGQVLDGVTAQAPAILTPEQLDAVRAVFADPTRCQARRQPLRGLLDRVALCGACGEPVRVRLNVSRPRNDGTRRQFRTYACPAKPEPGHCFVVTHVVDALVVPEVINAMGRIARHPRGDDFDLAASHAHRMELSHVREREQRITDAIADGLLTHAMANRTLRRIRGDRDRILTALTLRDNPTDNGANGIEDWQPGEGEEPYTVAERFLRRLPYVSPRYWPIPFTTDPQLRALAVRQDIEDDFADLPLLVQQAVIHSTVRVVINPSTTPDTEARVRVTPL